MSDTQNSSKTNQELLDALNARAPSFLKMMGGQIVAIDPEAQSCTLDFNISTDFCHSGDIIQGGFITAMLDAAMSHAVFGVASDVTSLSSLEISTRYLDVARAGAVSALGRVVRLSWKTAFLEGSLLDAQGKLLSTTQTVARIRRG